jgi:hypothetical protein
VVDVLSRKPPSPSDFKDRDTLEDIDNMVDRELYTTTIDRIAVNQIASNLITSIEGVVDDISLVENHTIELGDPDLEGD